MQIMEEISRNSVLISAVMGWFVAQFLKAIIDFRYTKTISLERLWGSGGMPSSHASTVCALATASVYQYGFHSFNFAISFIFATIVMHDAMGVRQETGKQSKLLNQLLEMKFWGDDGLEGFEKKLKELVGHTPLQVLMGGILGVIVGIIVNEGWFI